MGFSNMPSDSQEGTGFGVEFAPRLNTIPPIRRLLEEVVAIFDELKIPWETSRAGLQRRARTP
jgi:hypothetical protein